MDTKQEKNKKNPDRTAPWIAVGSFVGLLVIITARIEYYKVMGYHPNMGPQVAYVYSPVLLLFVLAVAAPVEWLFRYFQPCPGTIKDSILLGLGYSTILLWWAFPDHWQVFLLFNPILLRWLIGLTIQPRPTR